MPCLCQCGEFDARAQAPHIAYVRSKEITYACVEKVLELVEGIVPLAHSQRNSDRPGKPRIFANTVRRQRVFEVVDVRVLQAPCELGGLARRQLAMTLKP